MAASLAARLIAGFAAVGLSLALAAGAAAQAPDIKAQRLPAHHPAHAAPRSLAPPARLLPGDAKPYGGAPIDVLTYHYDNYRTGWNPTETDLTAATVASGDFGLLHDFKVDGNVFAQPLLVSGFVMPDHSTHDVLIIATGHDSVYAFDAKTFATLWRKSLGTAQNSNDVGCGDILPEYGVTSTPIILRYSASTAVIYLVAATEPTSGVFHTQLHALSVSTGADVVPPVEISPTAKLSDGSTLAFDPKNQYSRAGLAYANGNLYVAIGSHCDSNAYAISGWLIRYTRRLQLVRAFHTIETPHGYELASIWMSGFAPAIDPVGNIFVVTGNGDYTDAGAEDYGESVLRLAGRLPQSITDRFTPIDYATLNNNDTDFGSGGVMLLPAVQGQTAPPMAVAMGKDAVLYLLNQKNLGGLHHGDQGALKAIRLGSSGSGIWGGPSYWNGPAGPTVFVQINGDVLRSYSVSTGSTPTMTAQNTGFTVAGYGGAFSIVSSNGATAGSGVVWLIRRSAPVELEAYDAGNLGRPIFSANVGDWSNPNNGNPFLTPMEANGRVYVPGYLSVKVFGLTQ